MTTSTENPEKNQDRVFDLFEMFEKHKQIMFHQQLHIYNKLATEVKGKSVLELGCGTGLGTAIMGRAAKNIIGTDKGENNIKFAQVTYPWIPFYVVDLNYAYSYSADVVVCVEALEHVTNVQFALKTMLHAANEKVWVSTPNGNGKKRPPENPYHVQEYTVPEMLELLKGYSVIVRTWDTWEEVSVNTKVDPLVYEVLK